MTSCAGAADSTFFAAHIVFPLLALKHAADRQHQNGDSRNDSDHRTHLHRPRQAFVGGPPPLLRPFVRGGHGEDRCRQLGRTGAGQFGGRQPLLIGGGASAGGGDRSTGGGGVVVSREVATVLVGVVLTVGVGVVALSLGLLGFDLAGRGNDEKMNRYLSKTTLRDEL